MTLNCFNLTSVDFNHSVKRLFFAFTLICSGTLTSYSMFSRLFRMDSRVIFFHIITTSLFRRRIEFFLFGCFLFNFSKSSFSVPIINSLEPDFSTSFTIPVVLRIWSARRRTSGLHSGCARNSASGCRFCKLCMSSSLILS